MRADETEPKRRLALRPEFWSRRDEGSGSLQKHSLNLRRLWKTTVLIMTVV
jgi:hypothetical protein